MVLSVLCWASLPLIFGARCNHTLVKKYTLEVQVEERNVTEDDACVKVSERKICLRELTRRISDTHGKLDTLD